MSALSFPSDDPAAARSQPLLGRDTLVAGGAILGVLALQLSLVLNRGINWDEFWHYSLTVQAANGTLDQPLQTFFTRLFAWVPALPGNPVDHIVLIRFFMFGCELVTIGAIIGIASRFTSRASALLCGLAYISAGFVFQHGTSFRFDPQATALLMSSLWVLFCRPQALRWMALAGLLGGLATLITIKSVLYAPAFAGALWLRWNEDGRRWRYLLRIAIMLLTAVGVFFIAYWVHANAIVEASGAGAQDIMAASAQKMFSLIDHPYWRHNLKGAVLSPVTAVLALSLPVSLVFSRRPVNERMALAGLWLPLTSVGFYHNTAPYFHVFMLAPVAVSLSAVIPGLVNRYGKWFLIAGFGLGLTLTLSSEKQGPRERQRAVIAAASNIFPSPVPYFDSCAMLGQFPKANPFMTPWGTSRYLRGELPSMTETIRHKAVPLVVNNDAMFEAALNGNDPVSEFRPDDLRLLRSVYVHFWGPFWLAGFELASSPLPRTIEVVVPGPYTIAEGSAEIDGIVRRVGDVFQMARGTHAVAPSGEGLRLIWGEKLRAPDLQPPSGPLFDSF